MFVNKKLDFIIKQYENNKLSHAFLVETNNIEAALNDIKTIIKIINCNNKYQENCNKCNICNLINKNNLPSLVTINPDGMSIKREQIDNLVLNFSTKPIYSKYNTYIITNAHLMNSTSSNVLLKFLEEPNENIIGFLITNDMKQILPTIKSRCECVNIFYDIPNEISDNIKNIGDKYLDCILNSNSLLINKDIILSLDLDRNQIIEIFLYLYNIYKVKLEKNISSNGDNNVIIGIINLIEKEINYLNNNVNIELVLDDFVIEMRRLS